MGGEFVVERILLKAEGSSRAKAVEGLLVARRMDDTYATSSFKQLSNIDAALSISPAEDELDTMRQLLKDMHMTPRLSM